VPHWQEFSPPENWFGPDARAITLNWLDSTYTSQSCLSADGVALPEISGRFSVKDTIWTPNSSYVMTIIRFNNGITMAKSQYLGDNFWHSSFSSTGEYPWGDEFIAWLNAYMNEYQLPNQFVRLIQSHYHGNESLVLHFFCINPRNNSKQLTIIR
jgi:hypothetical protein